MFLGRYYHNLESKGRLAIPPSFRRLLGKKPIITRGLDGCLFLMPSEVWQKLTSELRGSPLTKQDTREFIRLMAHEALGLKFDSQGRTLIPGNLRALAHITKAVVLAGSLDWVEIWDQATYHTHMQQTAAQAEMVAERLSEVNISKTKS